MLARDLGLAVGMWDWWRIRGLHTPQEWAVQLAANELNPIGEDRADFRQAVNTAQIVISNAATTVSEDQIASLIHSLRTYLRTKREEPPVLGPAAIRQALGE